MKTHVIYAALAAVTLGGCATYSADGGFGAVGNATRERGLEQEVRWARHDTDAARTNETLGKLLASPLTPDASVQVALLNNHGLQATYADLGIAESDVVQAGRLINPGFVFERLHRGPVLSIDRTFLFSLFDILTLPTRTDIEKRRFELVQSRLAAETLQVAADTRRAWARAVATQETVRYLEQVLVAAEAGAELARRMAAAGNFNKLDQAREQVFQSEATVQLARARQAALGERERLTRLLGLSDKDTRYALPDRLPALPGSARDFPDIEQQALAQRLDVQGAMKEAESIAASLGLTQATGFVNVLEVGYRRNSESGQARQTGYEIELRLPIFDWGTARVARAEYAYLQAVNRAADTAVRARSEVREAYGAYRSTFDLAKHYRDEIVPLRKNISEETLLRYNGMLASVFELLADARQQVAVVNAYIEAMRDFWLADASLQLALTGKSPGPISIPPTGTTTAAASAGH